MAVFIGEIVSEVFERYHLSSGDGMNESWLQEQLFIFPALLNHLPNCQQDAQLEWLTTLANKMVNLFRPLLR